jgi:hypothetical protein
VPFRGPTRGKGLLWKKRLESGTSYVAYITAQVEYTSDQPIYNLEVLWHNGSAPWSRPEQLPFLMPGDKDWSFKEQQLVGSLQIAMGISTLRR